MFFFLLLEGFIGAVLVKKELVENDASMSRAVVISLHLVNTMLLMMCAVGTAVRAGAERYRSNSSGLLIWLAMGALVLTNATGAVTALGDTIFPIQPAMGPELIAKIRDDLSAGQHFLVRLRVLHPAVAALAAAIVFGVMSYFQRRGGGSKWTLASMSLVVMQVCLGAATIASPRLADPRPRPAVRAS